VVVGGGAGGLELVTRLARQRRLEVTLVDQAATHVWKPLLHEVAAGVLNPGESEVNYLAHGLAHGYRFEYGSLMGLNRAARTIRLAALDAPDGSPIAPARELGYDYLVLAIGSLTNDFGTPGVKEHCYLLNDTSEAIALHRMLLKRSFQMSLGSCERLSIGIVGGGATGVELAAEIHHALVALHALGARVTPGLLELTVVEAAPRLLPASQPEVGERAAAALDQRGVHVVLGQRVTGVTAAALLLEDGTAIDADIKVWASGIKAPDFLAHLDGLDTGRGNQLLVNDTLRTLADPHVYAFGDCVSVTDSATGKPVPATAQAARQQAIVLAHTFAALAGGGRPSVFHYRDQGSLVSLGRRDAVGSISALRSGKHPHYVAGLFAKFMYVSLYRMHQATLHGWPRTLALILSDWLRSTASPPVKLH
jgi:NADH dehydrogenase